MSCIINMVPLRLWQIDGGSNLVLSRLTTLSKTKKVSGSVLHFLHLLSLFGIYLFFLSWLVGSASFDNGITQRALELHHTVLVGVSRPITTCA